MSKKIALVLLAAGDSRRFGGNKLLSDVGGIPMYRHLADQVAALPGDLFCQKILVTQYPEIAEDLESSGYEVVENTQSCLGISHSIHLALDHLHKQTDAACFAVCDQPWLRGETIQAFLKQWKHSDKGIGCLGYKDRLGNPGVYSRNYFTELYALSGDVGGKQVLSRHQDDVYLYMVENEKELTDIDKNACHRDGD